MEDDDGGLLNIDVGSSDESAAVEAEKVPRDFQSEDDFQRQRAEWRPNIETGEIWKTLKLPMDNPSKPEAQIILHAIEELYFFGRFQEAGKVAEDVLKGTLNKDFKIIILDYRARCEAKVQKAGNCSSRG